LSILSFVTSIITTPHTHLSLPPSLPPPAIQRVILKYIEAEHKDPANGEELTPDDLITVKSSKGEEGEREGGREGGEGEERGVTARVGYICIYVCSLSASCFVLSS